MSSNVHNNRSCDKFKSVRNIKNVCATETEKLADEISWSSSEGKLPTKRIENDYKERFKPKEVTGQSINIEYKVKKWLENSKPTANRQKGRKKITNKKAKIQRQTPTLNICVTRSENKMEDTRKDGEEVSEDSSPPSPILIRSQVKLSNIYSKQKFLQNDHSNITAHCTPNKVLKTSNHKENDNQSPVLRTRQKINKTKTKLNSQTKSESGTKHQTLTGDLLCVAENPQNNLCNNEYSPVLQTYMKKRKLIENDVRNHDTTAKSITLVKKVLFPLLNSSGASQLCIDFSNTPSAGKETDVIESLNSNRSGLIDSISETQKNTNETLYQITELPSSPTKTSPSLSTENKKLTITFDITNHAASLESPVKKKKRNIPSDSVAGRLQKSIRKQKSSLSLWRHEHYLAANSNFQIPAVKDESLLLKITNLEEDFGKFIIRTRCINDENSYSLILNNYFVKKLTLSVDSVIKIFKPFLILKLKKKSDNHNEELGIVNVCRIESVNDPLDL